MDSEWISENEKWALTKKRNGLQKMVKQMAHEEIGP